MQDISIPAPGSQVRQDQTVTVTQGQEAKCGLSPAVLVQCFECPGLDYVCDDVVMCDLGKFLFILLAYAYGEVVGVSRLVLPAGRRFHWSDTGRRPALYPDRVSIVMTRSVEGRLPLGPIARLSSVPGQGARASSPAPRAGRVDTPWDPGLHYRREHHWLSIAASDR